MKEYKLIVAGGREFSDYQRMSTKLFDLVENEMGELANTSVSVVSGMARGADALAVQFCKEHGVKLHQFPADWTIGRQAGYIRNNDMAEFADGLLAYWDGESRGTKHMINLAKAKGLDVWVEYY